jgi:hypothetical protein
MPLPRRTSGPWPCWILATRAVFNLLLLCAEAPDSCHLYSCTPDGPHMLLQPHLTLVVA